MFDMAWTSTTVDTGAWLDDWAVQRCGGSDASNAIAAWRLLATTVYANRSGEVYEHEMPGGQYTNLQFQSTSLGLSDQWAQV
jgi:hypothetical protein